MPDIRHAWLLALALAGVGCAANAGSLPQPVCGRNEVLDLVADDFVRRGVDAVIVPGIVGETPVFRSNAVRCSVRLQTTSYDTDRFGTVPQVHLSILEFTVHPGHNGLFVDAIGNPR